MLDMIIERHGQKPDRELLLLILAEQLLINEKLDKMSNDAQDLQALVAQLKGDLDTTKTSLDAIKAGVATIVGGLNPGGLTADEVTALKASLLDATGQSAAIAQEAQEDAAAVAAAQPEAPAEPQS